MLYSIVTSYKDFALTEGRREKVGNTPERNTSDSYVINFVFRDGVNFNIQYPRPFSQTPRLSPLLPNLTPPHPCLMLTLKRGSLLSDDNANSSITH